jgi:hypothetical protein
MSHGLQALISYNLAKSNDLGSDDQSGLAAASVSQVMLPSLTPSDFDIRNSIAGAVSYEIPAPAWGHIGNAILRGWVVDGLVRVSATNQYHRACVYACVRFGQDSGPDRAGPALLDPRSYPARGHCIESCRLHNTPRRTDRRLSQERSAQPIFNRPDRSRRTPPGQPDRQPQAQSACRVLQFLQPSDVRAPGSSEPGNEFDSVFGKIGPGSTTNLSLGYGAAIGGQSPLYTLGGPRSAQFTIKLQF